MVHVVKHPYSGGDLLRIPRGGVRMDALLILIHKRKTAPSGFWIQDCGCGDMGLCPRNYL
jgi:hypothetical protein